MAKDNGSMVLVGLGAVVTGLILWLRKPSTTVTFTVLLQNPPDGSLYWDCLWWDGSRLVVNKLGLSRPLAEAALFQAVAFTPSSYVMVRVTSEIGVGERSLSLPNPVNFAGYGFDWAAGIIRIL